MRKPLLSQWISRRISRWISRQRLRQIYRIGLVVVAVAIALAWQQLQQPSEPLQKALEIDRPLEVSRGIGRGESRTREPIQAIPIAEPYDLDKYKLGKKLFEEPGLSKTGQISCASCHKLEAGGADEHRYSSGIANTITQVNTPTIFNIAYNFRFNWDGEYDSLAVHTNSLIQDPKVMGGWEGVIPRLAKSDGYQQAFESIYTNGISQENVIDAIVTYEAALTTPNAAFDRYLQGDRSAISAAALAGYDLFKTYGCASCHQGTNVGGNMFQPFGVMGDYFRDRGNITQADLGRFNITGNEADRYVFRVPTLRNVATTPPYFHDGSAQTLKEAIEVMVKYQLGRPIPSADIEQIAEFLETLTGEVLVDETTTEQPAF